MPGKHKNRRARRKPRPVQIRVKVVSVPAGVSHGEFLAGLDGAVVSKQLPDDWEVDIMWRNPTTQQGRSKDWQRGDWETVLTDSSPGFQTVVANAVDRQLGITPAAKRKASPTRKAPAKKKAKRKPTEKQVKAKRSAASRKGWITRRANAAKKGGA